MQKVVTLREKTALFALAAGYIETWMDCYVVASQTDEDTTRRKSSLSATVQRWKARQDIKDTYTNAQRFLFNRDEQTRQHYIREVEKEGKTEMEGRESERIPEVLPGKRASIDYTNPENQAKKLNELVNRADNTGEALDALKVIIQTQKADRDAAREGKQVRCYVPITCDACPLYEEARKR
jgi:hypothetical protein